MQGLLEGVPHLLEADGLKLVPDVDDGVHDGRAQRLAG
jgi:hypothetical protein